MFDIKTVLVTSFACQIELQVQLAPIKSYYIVLLHTVRPYYPNRNQKLTTGSLGKRLITLGTQSSSRKLPWGDQNFQGGPQISSTIYGGPKFLKRTKMIDIWNELADSCSSFLTVLKVRLTRNCALAY